jgi:hypothetical protein
MFKPLFALSCVIDSVWFPFWDLIVSRLRRTLFSSLSFLWLQSLIKWRLFFTDEAILITFLSEFLGFPVSVVGFEIILVISTVAFYVVFRPYSTIHSFMALSSAFMHIPLKALRVWSLCSSRSVSLQLRMRLSLCPWGSYCSVPPILDSLL